MTAFHVGQKVVCIDSEWHDDAPILLQCPLELNKIYTVVALFLSDRSTAYKGVRAGRLMVVLAEADNPYRKSAGFDASRFRPVVGRKTSIAIFHEILHSQRVRTENVC